MFDISQYEHSSVANKHGIDNKVPEDKISHIEELDSLLDKVGEAWASWCKKYNLGKTGLILTSGYRNSEVNSYVNGSTSSPHVEGYAADIVPTNKNTDELIKCVLDCDICSFCLIILVTDLVCDLITDLDRTEYAITFVR